MNGLWKKGALAFALGAALTISGVALADVAIPKPAPKPVPAADKGKGPEKAADNKGKGDEKGKGEEKGKGDEKADKDKDGGTEAGATADDAETKKAKEAKHEQKKADRKAKSKEARAELKKKVEAALKGQPMAQAFKEELKRHAQRLARLERAKDLAEDEKDTDNTARAQKLIDKENARHDKWMANYDAKATPASDKAGAK